MTHVRLSGWLGLILLFLVCPCFAQSPPTNDSASWLTNLALGISLPFESSAVLNQETLNLNVGSMVEFDLQRRLACSLDAFGGLAISRFSANSTKSPATYSFLPIGLFTGVLYRPCVRGRGE